MAHLDRLDRRDLRRLVRLIPDLRRRDAVVEALGRSSRCGTLAGAVIPELIKVVHLDRLAPRARGRHRLAEGGASLNILSGLVAGNFSAFWMGITIVGLMASRTS